MKQTRIPAFLSLLILLASSAAQAGSLQIRNRQAHPTGRTSVSIDEAWNVFWPRFRNAVNKRDRVALMKMTAARFETNSDGNWTANQVGKWLDQGAWRQIQRSAALGTKPYSFPGGRRPIRITNDEKAGSLIFEFGTGGRWRWKGLLGD